MDSSQGSDTKRIALERAQEGLRLISAGDYQGAIEACTEAIELDPRSLGARRTRVEAYNHLGKGEEAFGDLAHIHEANNQWITATYLGKTDLVFEMVEPVSGIVLGYSPKTATCERMVAWDGRLGALDVNTPRAGAFGEVGVVVQPATTSGCPGRCRFGCRQGSGCDCCAGSSWGRVPR